MEREKEEEKEEEAVATPVVEEGMVVVEEAAVKVLLPESTLFVSDERRAEYCEDEAFAVDPLVCLQVPSTCGTTHLEGEGPPCSLFPSRVCSKGARCRTLHLMGQPPPLCKSSAECNRRVCSR